MCKFNPKNDSRFIDPCMKMFIFNLNILLKPFVNIVACCCGHGKYSMTIVVAPSNSNRVHFDIVSGEIIPRKRNFYKKDKQGYYYIPEVIKNANY